MYIQKISSDISAKSLFQDIPVIPFSSQHVICPHCNCALHVQKTLTTTPITMDIGSFHAKETILKCPKDQTIFHSEQLRKLTPAKGTFGFDVIVHVGKALFIYSQNNQSIMKDLALQNIPISEREISYLGKKFITYLSLAHRESREQIRNLMKTNGGYILHIDGTSEGDSPHLFCGIDGISELVLDSIKIPSEQKNNLVPFFERIKEQYGKPIAIVQDMSRGIITAVEVVFQGIPLFICHFHFLRDIGKDLLLEDYQSLMKYLRELKARGSLRQKERYLEKKLGEDVLQIKKLIKELEQGQLQDYSIEKSEIATCVLINWIFDAPSQSNGYGFPFDRQHLEFYRRLKRIHKIIGRMSKKSDVKEKHQKPFFQLWKLLDDMVKDNYLNKIIKSIETKVVVFDKLREAMRITLPNGKEGLNDEGDGTDIKTIEDKVKAYRDWLTSKNDCMETYSQMLEQIDKYWEKLFSDPIKVCTKEGEFIIVPQRTNNILEQFFRNEKRCYRKKSGTGSLRKTLKTMLAETPFVKNLENKEYYQCILNGCKTLEERFSQIDVKLVLKELKKEEKNQMKAMPEMKKMIKMEELPEKLTKLFECNRK